MTVKKKLKPILIASGIAAGAILLNKTRKSIFRKNKKESTPWFTWNFEFSPDTTPDRKAQILNEMEQYVIAYLHQNNMSKSALASIEFSIADNIFNAGTTEGTKARGFKVPIPPPPPPFHEIDLKKYFKSFKIADINKKLTNFGNKDL